MEISYTSKPDNHTLLIFLCGWGTTPAVVEHYPLPDGWDYMTIHNYMDMLEDLDNEAFALVREHQYGHVYLVAWSMGVWSTEALSTVLPKTEIAVALNGTPFAMNNEYGIPESIFKGTLEGLNDDNRARFDRRMCGGKNMLAVYNSFSARKTDDLRKELLYVYEHIDYTKDVKFPWTRAVIGEKDLIIPPSNQENYWHKAGIPIERIPGIGHYPFLHFQSWQDLLNI